MMTWQRFLDSLDSAGGHVAILVAGVILGATLLHSGTVDGKTVLIGAGGALLTRLKA